MSIKLESIKLVLETGEYNWNLDWINSSKKKPLKENVKFDLITINLLLKIKHTVNEINIFHNWEIFLTYI